MSPSNIEGLASQRSGKKLSANSVNDYGAQRIAQQLSVILGSSPKCCPSRNCQRNQCSIPAASQCQKGTREFTAEAKRKFSAINVSRGCQVEVL